MSNLPQLISLLPKYKDLCKIMKLVIVLQDKIDELEQRIEKLEDRKDDQKPRFYRLHS